MNRLTTFLKSVLPSSAKRPGRRRAILASILLLPLLGLHTAANAGVAAPPTPKVIVIGANHASPDGISFVANEAIVPGDVIHFTENEYNDAAPSPTFFDNAESTTRFTGATLAKGDVVFINEPSPNSLAVTCTQGSNCGTATKISGGSFALSSYGEAIYAYFDTVGNADDPSDGVTQVYSVFYTGHSEDLISGGLITAITPSIDPSNDFPEAVVVDGFPSVNVVGGATQGRVEYKFASGERGVPVNKTNIENPANYLHAQANAPLSRVPFTTLDLDPPVANPVVTMSAAPSSVTENGGTGIVYTFNLDIPAPSALTINFSTTGTATLNTDYTLSSTSVSIPLNGLSGSVTVTPTGDTTLEPDETVTLTVSAGTGYDAGSPSSQTTTILNDDTVPTAPLVAITGLNHVDPDGFSFVALQPLTAGAVIYFTENDYDPSTLAFTNVGGEAVIKWTVPAGVDQGDVFAYSETGTNTDVFSATCTDGTGTATCGTATVLNPTTTSFSITSTGEAFYAYSDNDDNPFNGAGQVHSVLYTIPGVIPPTINPVGVYSRAVVVSGFTNPAPGRTEYRFDAGTADGQRGGNVDLTAFTNLTNWLNGLGNQALSIVKFDNITISTGTPGLPLTLTVSPSSVGEDDATGMDYTFTLPSNPPSDVTVNFDITGTADFSTDYTESGSDSFNGTTGAVTISSTASSATVTVTPVLDTDLEPDETVILTIDSGTGYVAGSPNSATGTILNDDSDGSSPIVAITGMNHDTVDGFSFVATQDIPSSTTVYFTERPFDKNSLTFSGTEGVVSWMTPTAGIERGDVIFVREEVAGNTYTLACTLLTGGTLTGAGCGTVAHVSGTFAISSLGEGLYAYSDSNTDPNDGVDEVYSLLYTADVGTTPLPSVEDPSTVYGNSIVVSGFTTASPNRVEYDPTKRGVLVEDADFTDLTNWLVGLTNADLDTTRFTNVIVGQTTVSLTLTGSPLAENGGVATVTANLSAPSTQIVTVDLSYAGTATDTSDYTQSGIQITIPANDPSGSVTITGLDDALDEDDETVIVTMDSVTNALPGAVLEVTATITDDDPAPTISIDDAQAYEGATAGFTVSLSTASAKTVTVDVATADGTATASADYTAVPLTTLTFNPGDTSMPVDVTTLTDAIADDGEDFFVNLSGPTNATLSDNQGQGTILESTAEVISILRSTLDQYSNAPTVSYIVYFSESIDGLTAANFDLSTTGTLTGVSIASVSPNLPPPLSGPADTWAVQVNTGTGDGELRLDLDNDTNLIPGLVSTLPFTAGESYIIDRIPPVLSVGPPSVATTDVGPVSFDLTYSDSSPQTVDLQVGDITLNATGNADGVISIDSTNPIQPVVTISNISGDGTLGITVAAGQSTDAAGNVDQAPDTTSATFAVDNPDVSPLFTKVFTPDTIGPGSTTTLVFTIDNTISELIQNIGFVDNLPVGVTIATPAFATTDCFGGNVDAPDGGSTITFSGGTLSGNTTCTVSVDVTSSAVGVYMNVTESLTSNAGPGDTATDDLNVVSTLPGFSKSFAPGTVAVGGRSTLTLTIDNTLNAAAVGALDFTDNLPAGMEIASPSNATTDCVSSGLPDTTLIAAEGTSTITLDANGQTIFPGFEVLPAGATCTVTVDVTASGAGDLNNRTEPLQADFTGAGRANARLVSSITPVTIQKTFSDDPVPAGASVTLEFTISNYDRIESATGVAFTDDLTTMVPALAGLTFDSLISNDCGGSVSGAGTTLIGLSGGTIAAESSCTIVTSLTVPGMTIPGGYLNTTSPVTATVGGSSVVGNAAAETLFVEPVPRLTKEFLESGTLAPDPVAKPGDPVVMRFTVTNSSTTGGATDIAFIDELTTFLPSPVSVTLPPVPNPPCGAGSSLTLVSLGLDRQGLSLTGGSLAAAPGPGDSCSFDVTLTIPADFPSGAYTNTTEAITATVDGASRTGQPASDDLVVVSAPQLNKSFTDDPVQPGGTVTLEFTLTNSPNAPTDATGIGFTDDLNAALAGLTATGLPASDVCGTGSEINGTTSLTFTGGTLTPGESCTFQVTLAVPAAALPGTYTNVTSGVTAILAGVETTSPAASDDLLVTPLTFTKEFIDDPIEPGSTVTLRFSIANDSPTDTTTGIVFTDNLNDVLPGTPDLSVSGPLPATPCGAISSLIDSGGFLIFTGGELAPASSCSFDLTLQVPAGIVDGSYTNTTSALSATVGGTVTTLPPAIDSLEVALPLITLTIAADSVSEADGAAATTATVSVDTPVVGDLTVNLLSTDTSEATVPASVIILNGTTSIGFDIDAVDDAILDGTQTVTLLAGATGYANGADTLDVTDDDATVTVSIADASISENGGATTATITRNTFLDRAVTVTLSSDDLSEATVPATVLLPLGDASVDVPVTAVDDAFADGTKTVTITAIIPDMTSVPDTVDVTDDEVPALTVAIVDASVSETAGAAATTATVSRNTEDNSAALTVTLASNDTSEATVPASLTIPAGAASAVFDIDAVDDAVADGTQTVTVTASSAGYADGSDTLDVTDDEVPALSIIFDNDINESDGPAATFATVSRNTEDNSAPLVVTLSSADTTEATVPPSVTIPAGSVSTTFDIDAVDDALADGTIDVYITASAAGFTSATSFIQVEDDDVPTLSVTITDASVSEAAGAAATTATVSRNTEDNSAALTVTLASDDTSEATVPASVIIPAGSASTSFNIDAVDDAVADGTQTVTVTASSAGFTDGSDTLDVTDDEVPTLTVDISAASIGEADGAAATTGTVSRNTEDLSAALTVTLASNDTSEADVPSSVTIPIGSASANFDIDAIDDAVDDGDQTVTVTASAAGFTSGSDTLDVVDDDVAGITVTPTSGLTTDESGTTADFTVVLNSEPTDNVRIRLSRNDSSEGGLSTFNLTFTPADWSVAQTVTVTGLDDDAVDGDITYSVITQPAISNDPNYSGLDADDVTVTNTDDDAVGITVTPTSGLTTSEAGTTASFDVVLDSQPAAWVTIRLGRSDSSEGSLSTFRVTFTPGNWNVPQTVVVTGKDDDVADGDITYSVITNPAQSSDPLYNGLDASDVSITNTDDDTFGITVTPTTGLVTSETGTTATFDVVLDSKPAANVRIPLDRSDSTEATISTFNLVFSPTNWNVPQTVTITGVNDGEVDGDIMHTIITNPAISTDPDYSGLDADDVSVTNTNVNSIAVLISPTSGLETTEAGGTATFEIVLGSKPTANVSFLLFSSNLTEGSVAPTSILFRRTDWNVPQVITITGVDDSDPDGDRLYAIRTLPTTSSDPQYNGINPDDVLVTNLDDEAAPVADEESGLNPIGDADSDGLPNALESSLGTDPLDPNDTYGYGDGAGDFDADGIPNGLDDYLGVVTSNPDVNTATDSDGDGIADYLEVASGSDPTDGNSPMVNGGADGDGDGTSDAMEALIGTDAESANETDGDSNGVADAIEVYLLARYGIATVDSTSDLDEDGLPDAVEAAIGSMPDYANSPVINGGADSDGDGVSDAAEYYLEQVLGLPEVSDTTDGDGDGLEDIVELLSGTRAGDGNHPVPGGI